jgi:acetyl-CoA C-acetyltransferase
MSAKGIRLSFEDAFLLAGARTPFVDYRGALSEVSPIDLGIKAARAVLASAGVAPSDIETTIVGSMAQASFDAYVTPRHVGLYAGAPEAAPAHLVQRICGTGIEAIAQAADTVSLGRARLALAAGTESMSRNPVAAYTHRNGFGLGKVAFKDFLFEALYDPAACASMGDTAENLARRYGITRERVDRYAEKSFARAVTAQSAGSLAQEIVPVISESFEVEGLASRGIELPRGTDRVDADSHVRPSPYEVLARLRPAFGGVQTGGNSSAIVDGAGAVLIASAGYARAKGLTPKARILAAASVGVAPALMGIGPVPAIRAVLEAGGVPLDRVGRVEINEAFGAQVLACVDELALDPEILNVNGGAIAIGHPLAATGIRLVLTLALELLRCGERYGIASACIGGGQGIAMLIENVEAA